MTGCQALTRASLGENVDDGTLTSYVKTKLASDRLVTLTRVGVETNNAVVYLTGEVETAEHYCAALPLSFFLSRGQRFFFHCSPKGQTPGAAVFVRLEDPLGGSPEAKGFQPSRERHLVCSSHHPRA